MSEVEIITVGNSFSWEIPFGQYVKSAPFRIHGMKCHLELRTGFFDSSDCCLYLENGREPADPFDLSVRLIAGKEQVSDSRTTVRSESTVIWRDVKSNLLKVVPKIDRHEVLFRIDLLGNTTHKEGTADVKPPLSSTEATSPSYHKEALFRDFAKFLNDSSSSDVEISCGRQIFKVHRLVLGARSEVFAAMLRSKMAEGESGRVDIDVDGDVFEKFVRYLYTGQLPDLVPDTAKSLYEISDKYAVEELRRACASFLYHGLEKDNACETLVLADRHGDLEFKGAIIQYMIREKIPRTSENWPDFCDHHPQLAFEVYDRCCEKLFGL